MENRAATFTAERLSFYYPQEQRPALSDISFSVPAGQFLLLAGPSGGGKTTLLRQLKTVLTPHGRREGEVYFQGQPLARVDQRTQTARIGFVLQSPENQLVTDKVWHELAFGLESLGYDNAAIRIKVAEMAAFFGMEEWFYADTAALSGGQKQILNLAAVLVLQPEVLLLDEPTSQLDPIAAGEFFSALARVNRELGVSIILSEQRLEEALSLADRLLVLEQGRLLADGPPRLVAEQLKEQRHAMFAAMPTPLRVYAAVANSLPCPLTVREGRQWLTALAEERPLVALPEVAEQVCSATKTVLEVDEVWFRYQKDAPDVLQGLSLSVQEGELLALLGGNGAGKTTLLNLICGLTRPQRGKLKIASLEGRPLPMAMLPQNPQCLFVASTLEADLAEMLPAKLAEAERAVRLAEVISLCQLQGLLKRHPYDLSGGEQQRAALAKLLLTNPRLLLLDEPTKGLDSGFKRQFAAILHDLTARGVTIIMVSHDIEFSAAVAGRCALLFNGAIVSEGPPRRFFCGHSFYTTAANRMARHLLPGAVTAEDIITACGGTILCPSTDMPCDGQLPPGGSLAVPSDIINEPPPIGKLPAQLTGRAEDAPTPKTGQARTWLTLAILALTIPLTIWCGMHFLQDRRYYFISMLVIAETMLPFLLMFERRKPRARELVVVAVLIALAVASRAAFAMLPQFKPITALVIISGVALGAEAGFVVGAFSAFISNFFFGQGPWTPWQMFGLGLIGFLAGLLFARTHGYPHKKILCLYGGLATYFIYGALMNPAAVLMFQNQPTREMFWLAYVQGLPFDIIHVLATVAFLWILGPPLLEKLERVKTKYGLLKPR